MQTQIENLLENIKADYINWTTHNGTKEISSYSQGQIDAFDDNVEVKHGKKYIKIVGGVSSGVWGFIVASENDKKFQVGDILMAAGWRGPARNKARGNVLSGNFGSRWTGPNYL